MSGMHLKLWGFTYELLSKGLIRMVQGTSFSVVLDYACGNGILLPTLANIGKTVIGFDLYPGPAKKIVTLYDFRSVFVMKADAMQIPLESASVDLVIAANVLEHFKELTIPLNEILRILRPQGILLVSVPSENRLYEIGRSILGYKKPIDHYQTGDQVLRALDSQMTVEKVRYFPPLMIKDLAVYHLIKARKG